MFVPPLAVGLEVTSGSDVLPALGTAATGQHRPATFTLTAGQTNRLSIQLEPRDQSAITHY